VTGISSSKEGALRAVGSGDHAADANVARGRRIGERIGDALAQVRRADDHGRPPHVGVPEAPHESEVVRGAEDVAQEEPRQRKKDRRVGGDALVREHDDEAQHGENDDAVAEDVPKSAALLPLAVHLRAGGDENGDHHHDQHLQGVGGLGVDVEGGPQVGRQRHGKVDGANVQGDQKQRAERSTKVVLMQQRAHRDAAAPAHIVRDYHFADRRCGHDAARAPLPVVVSGIVEPRLELRRPHPRLS